MKFHDITYDEVLKRGLKVMDLTRLCKENNLPIIVSFDMDTGVITKKRMQGEIGTLVAQLNGKWRE